MTYGKCFFGLMAGEGGAFYRVFFADDAFFGAFLESWVSVEDLSGEGRGHEDVFEAAAIPFTNYGG